MGCGSSMNEVSTSDRVPLRRAHDTTDPASDLPASRDKNGNPAQDESDVRGSDISGRVTAEEIGLIRDEKTEASNRDNNDGHSDCISSGCAVSDVDTATHQVDVSVQEQPAPRQPSSRGGQAGVNATVVQGEDAEKVLAGGVQSHGAGVLPEDAKTDGSPKPQTSRQSHSQSQSQSQTEADNVDRRLLADAQTDVPRNDSQEDERGNEVHEDEQDMDVLKRQLLEGDPTARCPSAVKLVRIFLSSTFTDTKEERNLFLSRSYPSLKEKCAARGYEFQVVDMRWGVGQGIANNHMTSDMCSREIELCQRLSTGPNFVTLLSHKYGYYAYPRHIDADVYDSFTTVVASQDLDLLQRWYVLDENAQPAHYTLRPVSTHYPDFLSPDFKIYDKNRRDWNKECDRIIEILIEAAGKVTAKDDYIRGVTDGEIRQGIIQTSGSSRTCLWYRRKISDLKQGLTNVARFADTLANSEWEKRNDRLLTRLKEDLDTSLPEGNKHDYDVTWGDGEILNDTDHQKYLDLLCSQLEADVMDMFNKAADVRESRSLGDPLLEELAQHTSLAQSKCRDAHGREHVMGEIGAYLGESSIRKPLLIYGLPGSGKTTVIAMTMNRVWDWEFRNKRVAIVARFIGSSPDSSRVGTVLSSMTKQIRRIYGKGNSPDEVSTTYNDVCEEFASSLQLASSERPLVVLVDSFNQLDPIEEAKNLAWLPSILPEHVKIIISMTEDEQLLPKFREVCHLRQLQLEGFPTEDAIHTLKQWLKSEDRWLTDGQFQDVQNAFRSCSLPLYVRLAMQEAVQWQSSQTEVSRLQTTIQEAINTFFVRIETNHGKIFTSHALGYLTLARRGLTEGELEDILSCDDEVLNEVFAFWVPPIRRLPPLLLVRLRNDLGLYIAQREVDNAAALLWNHQLFNDAARVAFCKDNSKTAFLHQNLADFFSGAWAGKPKPFIDRKGQPGSEDRRVVHQPITHGDKPNLRKLNNLPWHLAQLQTSSTLKEQCLFNITFLMTKMANSGIRSVIDDFTDAMGCFPEEKSLFESVRNAIQISQKALSRSVSELPTQLLNRFLQKSSQNDDIKKLLSNCREVTPSLVCDQQILTPPGGSLQHSVPGHRGTVLSLHLTSDGTLAVTCGEDRKVIVWDMSSFQHRVLFDTGKEKPIKTLLASNDQSVVLVTHDGITTLRLDTGKKIMRKTFSDLKMTSPKNQAAVPAVCVAGTARTKTNDILQKANIIAVTNDRMWKLGSKKLGGDVEGAEIPPLKGKRTIGRLSYCVGHEKYIAVTDEDHYYIRVFRLSDYHCLVTRRIFDVFAADSPMGPTIDAVCFSLSGNFLYVANWRKADILCLGTQDLLETSSIEGNNEDKISNFQVENKNGFLYYPSGTRVVIRDHKNNRRTCVAEHHVEVLLCATTNIKTLITVGQDSELRLWKIDPWKLTWNKASDEGGNREDMIRQLCLFQSTTRYALALKAYTDMTREVIVQDLLEKKVVRKATCKGNLELEMYKEEVSNITAIVRCTSGELGILDLDQMRMSRMLNLSTPEPKSPDDRTFCLLRKRDEVVALSSGRTSITVLNLKTNHEDAKRSIAVSGSQMQKIENFQVNDAETILAVGTKKGFCYVYELESGDLLACLSPDDICPDCPDCCTDFLKVICVTPDEKYLVLETGEFIKTWRINQKKPSCDLDIYRDADIFMELTSCLPLPGHKLLTVCEEGSTRVFSMDSGKTLTNFHFHDGEVRLSVCRSDRYLTYGEDVRDQTLAVWSTTTQHPVATFTSDQQVDHVTLGKDGHVVVACLRNPSEIIAWHVQDGTISRDESMDVNGKTLFQNQKLDLILDLDQVGNHGNHRQEDDIPFDLDSDDDLDADIMKVR